MAIPSLAEHIRMLEAEMRQWVHTAFEDSDEAFNSALVLIDHWAVRLAALALMAEKKR